MRERERERDRQTETETERRVAEFKTQELASTAWAHGIAGMPVPALLEPISVLDAMELQANLC